MLEDADTASVHTHRQMFVHIYSNAINHKGNGKVLFAGFVFAVRDEM